MATMTQRAADPKIHQTQCFIGGQWTPAASGKTFDTINPATEEVIAQVAEGDAADVDRAVAAARKAFESGPWRKMDARDRGRLIYRLADAIEENAEELAALEVLDNGKPISEARAGDLPLVIDVLRYYAGFADKIHGQTIPVRGNYFTYTRARTGGRGRADHSLEFSDADDGLEMGTGAGHRLHDRDEAGRADAAHLPASGPDGPEGWLSRRRDQRRAGLRTDGRRGDRQTSGRRQGGLHRRTPHGADHHARRRRRR